MNRAYLAVAVAALSYGMMDAGDIDPVLQEIERNNLELKALRSENRASVLDMKGENSLEAPSVEYSPFFRNGVSGVASSELVVSQEFDFPTLYAARNKSVKLQQEALDYEYQAARRNVLLTAKQKCFDLVMLDHMRGVLDERMANADELLVMYEKKFCRGWCHQHRAEPYQKWSVWICRPNCCRMRHCGRKPCRNCRF